MAKSLDEKVYDNNLELGFVDGGRTNSKEDVSSVKASKNTVPEPPRREITYIKGWRFHLISIAIGLCVFLVNMESSIVSTSLVTMSNEFHGFNRSTWVVTAYLSTYTDPTCVTVSLMLLSSGFLIIWARISDVFGRKWTYVVTNFIFLAFSAACGSAQSMIQLLTTQYVTARSERTLGRIICRAFQGMGASGAFSVSLTIFYDFIPPTKYPLYGALMSTLSAVGALGGPLLGGVIDNTSTWRWIFFFQIPALSLVLAFIIFLLPQQFPYHGSPALVVSPTAQVRAPWYSKLKEIDFIGALLLLCASILLITDLLEVSTVFTWHSAVIICLLTVSGVMWILFGGWESFLGSRNSITEPMFPRALLHNRIWIGIALTSFLVGIPSQVITIEIPQKAQAVYGDDPWQAGYKLIAYTLGVPVGSIVSNTIISRTKMAPIYLLFCNTALQTLGVSLMQTIPVSGQVPGQLHFFEVMIAFGVGGSFALLIVLNPLCIEPKYIATASGAVVQFRMTGCTLGLAAVTTALNNYLSSHLPDVLTPAQLKNVLQSTSVISNLPPELRTQVQTIFGRGYNLQLQILIGFTSAQFFAICLIWNKPQLGIKKS
ncbi:major facilitator superfamily transporter protein [Rutstroemia sp. NJR-2017a WRK4]|nr:major facilitator superfamily transporter protein [Rutstroemia sp. NJR-2017a WRK4]